MLGSVFQRAEMIGMFVCAICGNKRCHHSDDHRNACTGSNDPGQPGSRYGVPIAANYLIAGSLGPVIRLIHSLPYGGLSP